MSYESVYAELLDLSNADFDLVVDRATTERRRRFYADMRAKRLPILIAMYDKDIATYGEAPYCRDYADGMDGFMIHTRECPRWPDGAVSGSDCINFTRVR